VINGYTIAVRALEDGEVEKLVEARGEMGRETMEADGGK
jgi:hypothetical protein